MEKGQLNELLGIIINEERKLITAKDDYKAVREAAFETYEASPEEMKHATLVAKAIIKENLDEVGSAAEALSSMAEMAKGAQE